MAYYESGTYQVKFTAHGFGESKHKQTPYIYLSFMPQDGEHERSVELYLTDKTIERVVSRLRSLGWDGSSFDQLANAANSPFAGVEAELICRHEQNGEKTYERWDFPPPEGSTSVRESDAGVAKKLDALYGRELSKGGKPATAAPSVLQQAEDLDGADDIPF